MFSDVGVRLVPCGDGAGLGASALGASVAPVSSPVPPVVRGRVGSSAEGWYTWFDSALFVPAGLH